jgi:hypothetical protein
MSLRHRTPIGRIPCVIAALLALAVVLPAAASANPLLSGYGGPGQGSQTIIGSSLVNPPGGGGSSSAAGSGSGSELTVAASPQPKSRGASNGAAGHSRKAKGSGGGGAANGSPKAPAGVVPASVLEPVSSSSSGGTLGLSGGDALLIVCGLTALALTGVLTRRLTRRTHQ